MPNPKEIAQKKFDKALGFGYRMDDVEEYLGVVANEMQTLIEEKADLEKKLEVLADKLTEYRDDEESLRTAILSAQKLGDSLIRESKTKAEIIMRDATIKADALVGNARRQIERENETLVRIQREVAIFKNKLIELYKQHLELITSLPGDEEEKPSPKKEAVKEEPAPEVKEDATIEFNAPSDEVREVPNKEVSLTPDEEKALSGEDSLPAGEDEIERFSKDDEDEKGSLKNSFDELDVEDDEDLDLSFFNKATSAPRETKKKEMRFGESFKIKRDSSFPRF